jgi:hypothetical protein
MRNGVSTPTKKKAKKEEEEPLEEVGAKSPTPPRICPIVTIEDTPLSLDPNGIIPLFLQKEPTQKQEAKANGNGVRKKVIKKRITSPSPSASPTPSPSPISKTRTTTKAVPRSATLKSNGPTTPTPPSLELVQPATPVISPPASQEVPHSDSDEESLSQALGSISK